MDDSKIEDPMDEISEIIRLHKEGELGQAQADELVIDILTTGCPTTKGFLSFALLGSDPCNRDGILGHAHEAPLLLADIGFRGWVGNHRTHAGTPCTLPAEFPGDPMGVSSRGVHGSAAAGDHKAVRGSAAAGDHKAARCAQEYDYSGVGSVPRIDWQLPTPPAPSYAVGAIPETYIMGPVPYGDLLQYQLAEDQVRRDPTDGNGSDNSDVHVDGLEAPAAPPDTRRRTCYRGHGRSL